MRTADVCSRCRYKETCTENCEAYMTLARMTVNLGDFTSDDNRDQTHEQYLEALVDDLRYLTEI